MFSPDFDPLEKLVELELNIVQMGQYQEDQARQLQQQARTIEKITEQMRQMINVIHTQQTQTGNLNVRLNRVENLDSSK